MTQQRRNKRKQRRSSACLLAALRALSVLLCAQLPSMYSNIPPAAKTAYRLPFSGRFGAVAPSV